MHKWLTKLYRDAEALARRRNFDENVLALWFLRVVDKVQERAGGGCTRFDFRPFEKDVARTGAEYEKWSAAMDIFREIGMVRTVWRLTDDSSFDLGVEVDPESARRAIADNTPIVHHGQSYQASFLRLSYRSTPVIDALVAATCGAA